MINTITAEWSETIKKENGYFVFRYLLKGEEFRIRVLSKGKKHNQIIVLDEKLYFESWIYYGQEGVLSYDGEADRYFITADFFKKVQVFKKRFGGRLLSDLSILTKDMNWLFSFKNEQKHFRIISENNEINELEGASEVQLKIKKRLNRVFSKMIFENYRKIKLPETSLNTWHLVSFLQKSGQKNQPVFFNILKPLSTEFSEPFTGYVFNFKGEIFEIESQELKLFSLTLSQHLNLNFKKIGRAHV